MANASDSIWVGFHWALPVVGSVREAVEFVLAAAAGDMSLAKSKLQEINGKIQFRGGFQDESSSGYSTAESSGSTTPVGRTHVERISELKLEAHIKEVMGKHTHPKGKPAMKPEDVAKKLQRTQDEMVQKIRHIIPNFQLKEPLKPKPGRSSRGEHVINNDVISAYPKAVQYYIDQDHVTPITLDVANPLSDRAQASIMHEMVAHFNEDELYFDANSVVYGQYCLALKRALQEFLRAYNQGWDQQRRNQTINRVNTIAGLMNRERAYVDELALVKWVNNIGARRTQFENTKMEVVNMYTNWRNYFQRVVEKFQEVLPR